VPAVLDADPPRSPLEQQLVRTLLLAEGHDGPVAEASVLWRLFDAQVTSRHCDLAARWLRAQNLGFYTIASAGHESNAAVALAVDPGDPALLHYRSGGFYLARAGVEGAADIMAGICTATTDPISGGRHKVFGRHDLAIVPQTSTIASHLPRAVGVAFAIDRAARLGVPSPWPAAALAVCSFGDASANHSVAAGAFNTAEHCAHQGLGLPLLFVCEDNGLGISVRTPARWIETAFGRRPYLRYAVAEGDDPTAVLRTTADLADWVRATRRPAFLHLRTVRLGGHAGTDVETAYRPAADLTADAAHDPIAGTARQLRTAGATTDEILGRHDALRSAVYVAAGRAARLPQLDSAAEVMAPLHVPRVAGPPAVGERQQTLAQAINSTLGELLAEHPEMILFGEDVGVKGGVYGVTKGLAGRFGRARVFDTLLDETAILGLANGAAISGLLPVPEIQYLAYLHNAEDQLRGEAATLAFFSAGQYRNGMVVRVAGYGYQAGFGGHFHNDDSIAVLRDVPGIVIASPARPDDAAAMLRTCVVAAKGGAVCVFLEPIALYHTQDLHSPGDRCWLAAPEGAVAAIGEARTYGDGEDLTIVTFGNGLAMSRRVVARLAVDGVRSKVVDLRWIAPLPVDDVVCAARSSGRVLVVDETRKTGGISEGVLAALVDRGFDGRMARVASKDSPIPLGDAARLVLLSEAEIEAAARRLLAR
jgi:2-oxoisovalerate dehydrogenase E1 component